MTPAELAAADQAAAGRRERVDNVLRMVCVAFLAAFLTVSAYGVAVASEAIPAPSWSPIGQAQQAAEEEGPAPVFLEPGEPVGIEPAPNEASV